MFDKEILVSVTIGFGFLAWQSSYDTILNVQEFIFRSVESEDPSFTIVGYYATACQFVISAIVAVFAPTITNKLGPRVTMICGAILQLMFNLQLLYLNQYLIYFGNVLRALANSLTWTGQGRYLSQNSKQNTIIRNSSIFVFILHGNRILGNGYILLRFRDEVFIYEKRMELFGVMAAIALIAVIIFLCLPLALYNQPVQIPLSKSLQSTYRHFASRDNLALIVLYVYHGLQYSFFAGIYSNCLGFTLNLPNTAMVKMALSGLFTGCGGIIGGIFMSFAARKIKTKGFVMIGAFLAQAVNLITVLLNLPNSCPKAKTNDDAIISSSIYLAFVNAFVFGILDVILFSLAYSLYLFIFKDKISEAHATFRIIACIGIAVQFSCTPYFGLYGIIYMHLLMYLLTVVSYNLVERKHILLKRKEEENENK